MAVTDSAEASTEAASRQTEKPLERLAAAAVLAPSAMGGVLSVAIIAGLLGISWLAVYLAGGAAHVAPHWFYIPILLAAARFGFRGAAITGVAAGLLAGPLVPADVALGIAQKPPDELTRAIFFLVIGLLMAAIIGRLKTALSHEVILLGEERDLAARKAAVISTVSHEFRTPLSVILGTAETLHHEELPLEERRELLEGVENAARKLDNLVAGVLAVIEERDSSSRAKARLVPVDSVLTEVSTDLSRQWGERIRFMRGRNVLIWADPAIVKPALRAVLENALKFSPPGSPVSVYVVRRPKDIEITIKDAGPGISKAFSPHAFEPFTQADDSATRQHGGLGIGLFVARTLLHSAGGSIELLAEGDKGTLARVRLPGARSDVGATSSPADWLPARGDLPSVEAALASGSRSESDRGAPFRS